jgi:hypothetical protein
MMTPPTSCSMKNAAGLVLAALLCPEAVGGCSREQSSVPMPTPAPSSTATPTNTPTATPTAVPTWISAGPLGGWISALAIDPTTPQTLYAGAPNGVFKSTHGGVSWTGSNTGIANPAFPWVDITTLAIDPTNPQILYAGTDISGVYKSTDGGPYWIPANRGLANPFTNENIAALVIDPTNPQT